MFKNVLTRWIKTDRNNIETDNNIDIGLKNNNGSPIFLVDINLIPMQLQQQQ
jgi:hypothetical protein